MTLDIGELVGKLRIDEKGMDQGLSKGESKLKGFGSKISGLALGLGVAAGAALVAGLFSALGQQAIGAKISAQLGGTEEDARNYGRTAGKLYAENWGQSVEEIGNTIKTVAQAHILADGTPQELEAAARSAQILADVFGQDVEGSVRAVQQLIRNGLVPDAQSGFDLIAAGIQGGLDKSGDLLDTINEYSTEFRALGLNGSQAFGLMQQAVKAGARDTDTAADALKEFAIRSKDVSATSLDAYKSLGLNGKAMSEQFAKGGPSAAAGLQLVTDKLRAVKDPVEQNRIAVELFGTKAEDLGKSLFAMDLKGAETGFSNTAGAIKKAGDAVSNTPTAKLETFKREAQAAATGIAADLIPALSSAGSWIQKNQRWLKPLAETFGVLAGAIIAVNLAQKAWAATQAAWATITAVAEAVQWGFNAALLASPITWIVIAVVALVAVIVLIATKTDWFQKLWKFAWGGIKAAALATWSWIQHTLWPGIKAVFSAIATAAIWLWQNGIKPAFDGIVYAIQFAWRIISSIGALIAWAWITFVGKPIMWVWQTLVWPALQGIAAAAMWLWSTVLSPVLAGISVAVTWLGAAFRWLWENAIMPAVTGIAAAAMWLWHNALEPAFQGIAAAARWLWTNAISPVWNAIVSGVQWVGSAIKTVFDKVSGWIGAAFSGATGIVRGAMNGIITAINSAISGVNWVIDKANGIPGVNFPHIPEIPHLARGGAVNPSPGGTPVVMGDGGEVEYGVPKSDMESIIGMAVRAAGGAHRHAELAVTVHFEPDGVMKIVRTKVNREGIDTLKKTP